MKDGWIQFEKNIDGDEMIRDLILRTILTSIFQLNMTIILYYYIATFQFIVTPSNFEKPIKLQLPILLATYPLR